MNEPKLQAEDTPIWSDRPDRGIAFEPHDILLTLFSIAWAAGTLTGTRSLLKTRGDLIAALFAVVLGSVAVCIAASRFLSVWFGESLSSFQSRGKPGKSFPILGFAFEQVINGGPLRGHIDALADLER